MKWTEKLRGTGFQIPFLIDPTSYVSPSASIAGGSIISAKAAINTNVIIENGCIISIGSLIDHEVLLENTLILTLVQLLKQTVGYIDLKR